MMDLVYSCYFSRGIVISTVNFVGRNIDDIENQAHEYAQTHGVEYMGALYEEEARVTP